MSCIRDNGNRGKRLMSPSRGRGYICRGLVKSEWVNGRRRLTLVDAGSMALSRRVRRRRRRALGSLVKRLMVSGGCCWKAWVGDPGSIGHVRGDTRQFASVTLAETASVRSVQIGSSELRGQVDVACLVVV